MTHACSLNECPLPHNKDKIDYNTKARDARRTSASSAVRYYTDLSAGDHSTALPPPPAFQPGVLSPLLLQALGLQV